MRLFTASILILLATACGSDDPAIPTSDTSLPEADPEEELGPVILTDQATEDQLIGTWRMTHMNGESVSNDASTPLLKQAFLEDHTWLIGTEGDDGSNSQVGGGRWTYDNNTRQLSFLFLPDSLNKTWILLDVNDKKMQIETTDGRTQTWRKVMSADSLSFQLSQSDTLSP